jgi:hypothetical protein
MWYDWRQIWLMNWNYFTNSFDHVMNIEHYLRKLVL